MERKYKIKQKIISIIVIIANLMNIANISFASLQDNTLTIIAGWSSQDIPYSYNGGERIGLTRASDDNTPVYSLEDETGIENTYFEVNNLEDYKNNKIKNILKNGYGCKKVGEIGETLNDVEAFLATQEAIKIQLDIERNLTDYTIYNTQGRRILAATEEILNNARKEPDEEVKITTLDREWIEYQEDPRYKYKEFTIHSINKEAGKIKKEANKDIRVIDTVTKAEKTEFYDGDKFYLILPKNVGQEVILTFSYDNKEGLLMYKCNQNGKNYILAEQGTEHIETNIFIISAIETQVEIINQDKDTKEPIAGNIFDIINEDKSLVVGYLITNNEGKAVVPLDRGRYYLKQKEAIDGYNLNKALIEINIEKIEPVKIVVESTKSITEEITNINKETNMIEEDRNIIETNITEVSNIKTTNINREIINQTNETNLDNVNNFINTINRKNVLNLQKENTYRNYIDEPDVVQNEILEGENITLHMTRKDYINYIDMIMLNSAKVPILPVASKH